MIYKIIAIVAPSGAGKDSLLKRIFSLPFNNFNKIIRSTTRPKRDKESLDDYHFLKEEQWNSRGWLVSSSFNGWNYGVAMADLDPDKINIGVFTKNEIETLREVPQVFEYKVIYLKVSDKTRLARTLTREKNPNCHEICRRFLADEEDFKDIDKFIDHSYINETIEDQDVIINDIKKIAEEMMVKS